MAHGTLAVLLAIAVGGMPQLSRARELLQTGVHHSLSTYFSGCGTPYCGCGIPQDMLTDDHGKQLGFVAVNTFTNKPPAEGEYKSGRNCGRIVKIEVGNGCSGGANDPNNMKICIKNGRYGIQNYDTQPDAIARTRKVLYAMIVDSCADNNYWCRQDRYHLDISKTYLEKQFGSIALWNNRKITWSYYNKAPPGYSMTKLKFAWGPGASRSGNYLPLTIANTPDGIRIVHALLNDGTWQPGQINGPMGSQWKLPTSNLASGPNGAIKVMITSKSVTRSRPYGIYWIPAPNGAQQVVRVTGVFA